MNPLSSSNAPSPYGRACTNCARAKAKCVPNQNTSTRCGRCQRLNKECQPSTAFRKRNTIKKTSDTKSARLEEKLDGLVTLLTAATRSAPPIADSVTGPTILTQIQSSTGSPQQVTPDLPGEGRYDPLTFHLPGHTEEQTSGYYSMGTQRLNPHVLTPAASYTASPGASLSCGFEPSYTEAHQYLETFRTQLVVNFPFIVIPASTTAQVLYQDRHFLWLCIMAVCSKSSVQQIALGIKIRHTVGQEVLVEGEKNLDLLLGILIYLTWGQYHINNKPILTSLMQVAIALSVELHLNKPPHKAPLHMMLNFDARGCPKPSNASKQRTTEERRAIIGCFLLSSEISLYFQKIDALRWTPYLEETLCSLDDKKEDPNDVILVHLVRLRLIVGKAAEATWHDGLFDTAGSLRAPPIFFLKTLQADLQEFKRGMPPELQQNEVLLLHLHSTELRVYELASSKAPDLSSGVEIQRLNMLFACLQATKSWFTLFLNISPASYIGFSISTFTQMAHCIVILYRLWTFDDPGWDQGLVRETISLSLILDQIGKKLAQVKEAAELDNGSSEDIDIFSVASRRITSIKSWWDGKGVTDSTEPQVTIPDEVTVEETMYFCDDEWLKDILGLGDHQNETYM